MTTEEMDNLFREVSDTFSRELYKCCCCGAECDPEDAGYRKHQLCERCYWDALGHGGDL